MKLQATVKVRDRMLIEIDSAILRQSGIKEGQLFEQGLTPEGHVLLKRVEK